MKQIYKSVVFLILATLVFSGKAQAAPEVLPAGGRLGLFVLGLSGSNQFKTYFDQAPEKIRTLLLLNGYQNEDLVKFSEDVPATQENKKYKKWGKEDVSQKKNILTYLDGIHQRPQPYEKIFVFIAAHANGRDDEAMMHVPGNDLRYRDLMERIDKIPAQEMVIVVVAPQGEAWIQKLAKPGRVIIVGNGYRQYDFIAMLFLRFFPEVFEDLKLKKIKESGEENSEIKVSLTEVFAEVQQKIRHWYKENSLHCTEMALMDADADGKGDSLFVKTESEALTKEEEEKKLASEALKGESDEELPVDLNLPDALAGNKIHFIVKKGE